ATLASRRCVTPRHDRPAVPHCKPLWRIVHQTEHTRHEGHEGTRRKTERNEMMAGCSETRVHAVFGQKSRHWVVLPAARHWLRPPFPTSTNEPRTISPLFFAFLRAPLCPSCLRGER